MKKSFILYIICILAFVSGSRAQKHIVGYYPGWAWYGRDYFVNPQTIKYDNYTVIAYAFIGVAASGQIVLRDPWADKNIMLGPIDWGTNPPEDYTTSQDPGLPQYHDNENSLVNLAHSHGVKVIISLVGELEMNDFKQAAASPEARDRISSGCMELIRRWDLDGVDIDWEWPALEDRDNYTELVRALRDSMDLYEQAGGREMFLTTALGVTRTRYNAIDWEAVLPLFDVVGLMTYEYFGTWSEYTGHHSPLHQLEAGRYEYCIEGSVDILLNEYNVPADKVNIGLPFYCRAVRVSGLPGLGAKLDAPAASELFGTASPYYYNVLGKMDYFIEKWDNYSQAPYLIGHYGIMEYVAFENEKSVEKKCRFAVDNNLAGIIIWEITGDYIDLGVGAAETPLSDMSHNVLNNYLSQPPLLIAPEDNAKAPGNSVEFRWEETVGAHEYELMISRDILFRNNNTSYHTDMTHYSADSLIGGARYYWRVIPYRNAYPGNWSETRLFVPGGISVCDGGLHTIEIWPNPASEVLHFIAGHRAKYYIYNSTGQIILQGSIDAPYSMVDINTGSLAPGIYMLRTEGSWLKSSCKFSVVR